MGVRGFLALWVGKVAIACLRLLGRGASTLPGRLALRLCPDLPATLARRLRRGSAVVSGTNGKTTTATMLAAAAAADGHDVVHNRSGANLLTGVTTALLAGTGWGGRGRDLAVAEVDEATMPAACRALRPRVAVVTNFFRDQLDRYGELETAVALVRRGLAAMPAGATAVLNADDPLVAGLAAGEAVRHLRPLFYGVETVAAAAEDATAAPPDATHCRRCGRPLRYGVRYYAHLGRYACDGCGLARPEPEVALVGLEREGAVWRLRLRTPAGPLACTLALPGLYNVYNALAAAAGALALGVEPATVAAALAAFRSSFGRMEAVAVGERTLLLALVKNPTGMSEVLRTVAADPDPGKGLVLAINDRYADGRDVSWLWDADVERLAGCALTAVIATGTRAEDMALRLKYAGVSPERIRVERDLGAALDGGLAAVRPGGTLYVLPTYTAMLALRQEIARRGLVRAFWQS